MIAEFDVNKDNVVDFAEFLSMMARKMRDTDTEEELVSAFKIFDRNGDGLITLAEMRQVMTNLDEKLTSREIEELITEADINGTGKINYKDFIHLSMNK